MKKLIMLYFFLAGGIAANTKNIDYTYLKMQSAPFEVDDDYLSKHDIVYFSPTQLEAEGFPMGNGDIGGMVWNHDNGIELQINKNDLWTKAQPEEYGMSLLKHAARLKIDFGALVFSWMHLEEFEGRLSLANAENTYRAVTGYSATTIRTWLAQDRNVWIVECENIPDPEMLGNHSVATVSLERLGSRSFTGWYGGWFAKNPSVGLGKMRAMADAREMILEETDGGLHFAVACRVVESSEEPETVNMRRAEWRTNKCKFTIMVSVVTDREDKDPVNAAKKLLDEAEAKGVDELRREKDEWYRNFWSNSFVKLGDDYLENIYYLHRYLMSAGSRGEFPLAFNGGLWRWNRDVLNWGTPHHWNQQQEYWGLCAQNDWRLMKPYLDTYFKMIPFAEKLAKEYGAEHDALLITEAHNFNGVQWGKDKRYLRNNFTPASQIASLFWDYYEFTGDEEFLKERAYTFMKKASHFYLDRLEWDEEKNEYFLKASLYESAPIAYVKNPISDRNCIERLFKDCIRAAEILNVDKDEVKQWRHVLNHLWEGGYQQFGECGEVISPAEEYYTEKRYSPWIWGNGGAVAFPAGLIGIDDKDTRLGKAVVNLLKHDDECNAHYPYPQIAARMGEGDVALKYIWNGVNVHQMYPQGLMHNVTGYPDNIYDLASVHNLLKDTYMIRSHDFFQCGMEPMSNYCTGINEMMLQSNEEKIRVFPAVPAAWDSIPMAFILLARGAFLVSASRNNSAEVTQVGVKSLKGNLCRLQNPWGDKKCEVLRCRDGRKVSVKTGGDGVLAFSTQTGEEYVVRLIGTETLVKEVYFGKPNMKVKQLGKRRLGKVSGWNDFQCGGEK